MNKLLKAELTIAVSTLRGIEYLIKEKGHILYGELYELLKHNLTLYEYEDYIDLLVKMKLIKFENNELIYLKDPKK